MGHSCRTCRASRSTLCFGSCLVCDAGSFSSLVVGGLGRVDHLGRLPCGDRILPGLLRGVCGSLCGCSILGSAERGGCGLLCYLVGTGKLGSSAIGCSL